jgi:hypothetical protein
VPPQGRRERDHFPIPIRHGGIDTVLSCLECHNIKDRCGITAFGFHHDGTLDEPMVNAIHSGMADLPPVIDSNTGGAAPFIIYILAERMLDFEDAGQLDWNGSNDLVNEVEQMADHALWSISRCTTPEARICLASMFALYLDRLDDALSGSA